jgi:dephospho-CoA kinase
MKVIGIVGGVASGKSTVAAQFARLGAVVLDADSAAHRVLEMPDVKEALRARWGDSIFDDKGRIDRAAVAARVFGEGDADAERQFLESLVHPRVRRDLETQMEVLAQKGVSAVVLDVPLLVEAGWQALCDEIIFVEAPPQARAERAEARGWTLEELNRRESAQASLEEKRRAAGHVIHNAGGLAELRRQVEGVWSRLGHSASRPASP